jgi:hypothetical protein
MRNHAAGQEQKRQTALGSASRGGSALAIVLFAVFATGTNAQAYYDYSDSSKNNNNNDAYSPYRHNYHHHHVRHDIVVIKPTFTIAAYKPGGFYDYYRGQCDVNNHWMNPMASRTRLPSFLR